MNAFPTLLAALRPQRRIRPGSPLAVSESADVDEIEDDLLLMRENLLDLLNLEECVDAEA